MFSWMVGQSCKPCAEADPTSDTVKFDSANIVAEQDEEQKHSEAEEIAERARVAAEEQERCGLEVAAEMRRQKDEAKERARLERQREEEKAEAERQRAQEEERKREEEERVLVERERAQKEEADAKKQVEAWLSKNGYADVNAKKTQMFKTTYPIHHAVKQGDADAVRLLLRFRADPKQKCSGQTAHDLAQKQGKKASADVLSLLTSQTQSGRIAGA